ncbi:hypothetical protein ACOMHN_063600 [Nucella lapillus]
MQPKPKSAPAGRLATLQSRLAKNQSDAMKEMQAWARRAEEPGACCPVTRMSGQLTDNVTEERLLRAKLWELSKERYKFLLQNSYEKKLFADRMYRKTQAILKARANRATVIRSPAQTKPRPLTTSAITRPRPFPSPALLVLCPQQSSIHSAWTVDNLKRDFEINEQVSGDMSHSEDSAASEERNQMREVEKKWAMSGGREKVTPAATLISIPTPLPIPADDSDGRTVLAPLQHALASLAAVSEDDDDPPKAAHSLPPPPTNPRNVQFARVRGGQPWAEAERMLRQQSHVNASGHPPVKHNNTASGKSTQAKHLSETAVSSKPTSASSKRYAPLSMTTTTITANLLSPRCGQLHRFGAKVESKTSDPRYTSLEHSLIPVPHPRPHPDVSAIVQSFDALHVQPKLRKEVKPSTGLKAVSYMNERGFVF